ncbi:MAG TPA: DNA polymerase III subunit delta [Acidobacteriota bacterium]|nr:DNA polymerase III subunit delta [Acidobacteriota bacterium]
MYSKVLGKEIREEELAPGYFFHGEESYLADLFVRELASLLAPGDAPDFRIDRYYLDETGWGEILDTARTMPFLFFPWRVIVVRAPERKPDADKGGEKEARLVSEADEKLLKRYFADPSSRTVLVINLPGKLRKGNAAVRVLSSLPGVVVKDAKSLKDWEVAKWMNEKARSLGKVLAQDAASRLLEIVGNDLRRLENELEKLAVFVDEEKVISARAVDEATAWIRDFDRYELDNALEEGDLRQCLIVLDGLFKAEEKPEQVLSRLSDFVRNILAAKVWLAEKSRDRKEIFKAFFPNVLESYHDLYQRKSAAFFSLVDGLSMSEIRGLVGILAEADLRIKSTDAERRTVCEAFLFEYCRLRKKAGAISRASGRSWRPGG